MRSQHAVGTILVLGLAASAAPAAPILLRTADGLELRLAADGQPSSLTIGSTALPLLGPGGFFLADYHQRSQMKNLVPNPSFEHGTAGWSLSRGQTLDSTVAHTGQHSIRLHVPGPQKATSNLGCYVPVKPTTRYVVGVWVRRHNCGVCGAYVTEHGPDGKLTRPYQIVLRVPTRDDVWQFASTELETLPTTTKLRLRADIYRSTGTIWLDDFFVAEIPEPRTEQVTGRLQRLPDGRVKFSGKALDCRVQASFTPHPDHIAVDGTVADLTGRDRAVALTFRLPFDASGWTWFDDIHESRPVAEPLRYRNTYPCVSGIGECSVYPWSAISRADAGLSLALPLAQGPRVFIICYDNKRRWFEVTFFFGLAKDCTHWPSSAGFSFVLYRHDPQWGMRSALARYYALFPDSFLKRPTHEAYLNYARLERYDPSTHTLYVRRRAIPDASDFGEGYAFIWHMHGCYCFRMFHTQDRRKPSDETVLQFLRTLVEKERTKPSSYCPTSELIKKLVYDATGHIAYIGDTRYWKAHEGYNRTDKPGWGLNFRVNEDPGVSDFLARKSRQVVRDFVARHKPAPFTATLTADAIEGYACNRRALNYRRDHFRTTRLPLTFGKDNLKPAMCNTIWDFHTHVWWPLTQQYKVATYGNSNGYEQVFLAPFCDVPMIEWDWDRSHPGRLERFCRSIAYHKIWRFWRVLGRGESDPDSVRLHFRRGLAYAIFPAVYPLVTASGDIERYRHLYRQYVPAIEELSRAGWEPVPHARCKPPDVVIERFGAFASADLHFTLRNYSDKPVDVTIQLDLRALGISARKARELLAYDLLAGPASPAPVAPSAWRVTVPANASRAFWLGTRTQLATHALANAAYSLGRLERFCRAELSDDARRILADATALLTSQPPGPLEAETAALKAAALLDRLPAAISTKAPVDLAKMLYRIKADLTGAGVASSGLSCRAPRTVQAVRGASAPVAITLANTARATIADLAVQILSPWPEASASSTHKPLPTRLSPGKTFTLTASLAASAAADRPLLPYLLTITGRAEGEPFALWIPVDVLIKPGLDVRLSPQRLPRGRTTSALLHISSSLSSKTSATIDLSPPRGVTCTPSSLSLDLPAGAEQTAAVTVEVSKAVAVGSLLIPYSLRFGSGPAEQRTLKVRIVTPGARVRVQRAADHITIDGRLAEATWQRPPTIPAFKLLSGEKPTEPTRAWVAYDDAGLYVAFYCAESNMPAIRATYHDRGDPLYRDDDVEVFLLPPKAPQPLQLAVNPLGTQSDDFGNTADWKGAAHRLENAWTVEIFIPWKVLGLSGPPGQGFVLPALLGRQQKPKRETSSWVPANHFRDVDKYGELLFP